MKNKKPHINDFDYFYFLGIGGIGMSALARFFKAMDKQVCGYDKTQTSLTNELQAENMIIHYDEDVKKIPAEILNSQNKTKVLIVHSPAVPKTHIEYQYFEDNNFCIKKRAEVLGMLTQDHFTIAVAGTHGKTTITSMITHVLHSNGIECTAFVGGITLNYASNLVLSKKSKAIVVEADEYDRSFLNLYPDIAVISSIDPDHLDIYNTKLEIENTYAEFANQIKTGGTLIYNADQAGNLVSQHKINASATSYSLNTADWKASHISFFDDHSEYSITNKVENIEKIKLGIPGKHNVENSLAAFIVAKQMNLSNEKIINALGTYKGVKRRFEYHIKTNKFIYIDDYAHHPREIEAFVKSVKNLYPNKKITGIFQPHLFTRTRDFLDQFAASLSLLDELMLLEIYPARELPIPGINAELLLNKVKLQNKKIYTKEEVIKKINEKENGVILTIGAGDIDLLIKPITEILKTKI